MCLSSGVFPGKSGKLLILALADSEGLQLSEPVFLRFGCKSFSRMVKYHGIKSKKDERKIWR